MIHDTIHDINQQTDSSTSRAIDSKRLRAPPLHPMELVRATGGQLDEGLRRSTLPGTAGTIRSSWPSYARLGVSTVSKTWDQCGRLSAGSFFGRFVVGDLTCEICRWRFAHPAQYIAPWESRCFSFGGADSSSEEPGEVFVHPYRGITPIVRGVGFVTGE